MEFKDYYKILGVSKKASTDDIKKAYKKLAQEFHPDKNQGNNEAESKFKDINEAYQVLNDPDKRHKYDNLNSSFTNFRQSGGNDTDFNWQEWFAARKSDASQTVGDIFDTGGLSDFFTKIFGGKFSGARQSGFNYPPHRGEDITSESTLTLEEAFKGSSKTIVVNGEKIEVKFKPGINDGQTLRVSGKGKNGKHGGSSGDLIIKTIVKPHPNVKRMGNDLYMDITIDLYKAILGGIVNINSFTGKIKLTIPPETQPGKVFKLSGQGMHFYTTPDKRGDLYIKANIKLPKNLSDEEKDYFTKLKKLRNI